MSKRTIYLQVTIDWEDYDDVCDELVLEDTGMLDKLKEGVVVKQIADPYQLKIKFPEVNP